MIGIPLAWLTATTGDWLIHKYLLHGKHTRAKKSPFHFHFYEHHKEARRNGMFDRFYKERSILGNHAQGREVAGLVALGVAHLPLLPVAPFYTVTTWVMLARYYHVHRKSHLDPEWGREHLPWHYDHHMGPDQNANWGIHSDWFDRVMGTRVRYVGTERERRDRARMAAASTPS